MTERLHFHFSLSCIGEGNGNPLQCSCLENPRDGGAWWAAVYGVAQSRTRLKRLSSNLAAQPEGSVKLFLGPVSSLEPWGVGGSRRAHEGSMHGTKCQKGTEVSKVACVDFHLTPLSECSAASQSSTIVAFLAQFPCKMPGRGRDSHCTGKGRTAPHIGWQPASPFSAPPFLPPSQGVTTSNSTPFHVCGKIYPFLIDCTFIVCVFNCSVVSKSL